MHSGFVLVSGINKAFSWKVPALPEYLDRRLVTCPHLITPSLTKAGIKLSLKHKYCKNEDEEVAEMNYGLIIADVWQDKQKYKEEMYGVTQFKMNLNIRYFDVPELHHFDEQGNAFFDVLADIQEEELSIFERQSIQLLITMKWSRLRPIMMYGLFTPQVLLLFTNVMWHTTVRPFRDNYSLANNCLIVIQLLQVSFFIGIDII